MPLNRRVRRWLLGLGAVLALALFAGWWIGRLLQPERLTPILLAQAERALGLEIELAAPADYALRPEPRLRLSGLSLRSPGAERPLLRAEQVDVSLPWDALWGGEPVVTRLGLAGPRLDLPALLAWLAQRPEPEAPSGLPRLLNGLAIEDGEVQGEGWSVGEIELSLPRLIPGEPVQLTAGGRLERQADPARAPVFRLELRADHAEPARLRLEALALHLEAASPLPSLNASGRLDLGPPLALELSGELADWPADWPPLPAPLAESRSSLPFTLAYRGGIDLEGTAQVRLSRDEAVLQAQAVPARVLEWLRSENAPLLPPLTGTLTAPELTVDGVRLEGVRLELGEQVE